MHGEPICEGDKVTYHFQNPKMDETGVVTYNEEGCNYRLQITQPNKYREKIVGQKTTWIAFPPDKYVKLEKIFLDDPE